MKILSGINVYVNVTSFAWGGELFMLMLHHCFEYWYMKILSGINVYVNVTSFAWLG
jgi:hypothetical protein